MTQETSKEMAAYFEELNTKTTTSYAIAKKARKQGFDPASSVEIELAKNMAERVIGLISILAPQIKGTGAVDRIIELEKEYGVLDWRVSLCIAHEIATEKFCTFKDKKEAMEVGIRTGFAYTTVGVVSSPLEGFIGIDIKKRNDNRGEYFCLNYSGPIRNAGGTAAAVSVIIADYVRKKMGYDVYDPTEQEIKRCFAELQDYHERITNLQYFPSKDEIEFLMNQMPVEISGDPSERIEVSNFKNLPRVPTNLLRSGYCLIHSSCIPLKAPKLWKVLSKWGKDFDMEQWEFLDEFIKIQKKMAAKGAKSSAEGLSPNYTYIKDLVAGRPVLGHPLHSGGFRLRYGRSRVSGYSGQSCHPATMVITNSFLAIGTQLKVERPGKAAAFTSCDTIEGPIVLLKSGEVKRIDTVADAKSCLNEVKQILYLGDVLVSYGDFLNRAHPLVPVGYCEEWWALDVIKALIGSMDSNELQSNTFDSIDNNTIDKAISKLKINLDSVELTNILRDPYTRKPSFSFAYNISKELQVPLHPTFTFFWNEISLQELQDLLQWFKTATIMPDLTKIILSNDSKKSLLEILGVPHICSPDGQSIISGDVAAAMLISLGCSKNQDILASIDETLRSIDQLLQDENSKKKCSEILSLCADIIINDKSGVFVGSRMGRPEKAKMRSMSGSPHCLFPVGEQGGKQRSFQAALEKGHVQAECAILKCKSCGEKSLYRKCVKCGSETNQFYVDEKNNYVEPEKASEFSRPYEQTKIPIRDYFNVALKQLETRIYPDMIKGVKGTVNKEHFMENLIKGILRAKYGLHVNKDGTIRYDCSEIPITHFKPYEIHVSLEKLRKLGYTKDCYGQKLEKDDQILELKPQDIILPCCQESPEAPADEILLKVAHFIDELLVKLYGLDPFYKAKSRDDLIGHLVIGLAPHTSAGSVCRIVGFSQTQGFFAHPLMHAAMRRDCDGDESCIFLVMDAFLNFSRKYLPESRGSTMDAPLVLTSILAPTEVDDMVFDLDKSWRYPLEIYEGGKAFKKPWDIPVKLLGQELKTPLQYEGIGFTHDTNNINDGILCSAYKTLPSMAEKLSSQMDLAVKARSVNESNVAELVIEKHFLKDAMGNLRKFSQQQFRCVNCNTKYRRPPLSGSCQSCIGGKIIFTITEGSVVKYVEPSELLAKEYGLGSYLNEVVILLKRRIEEVFGKDPELQTGLGDWVEN